MRCTFQLGGDAEADLRRMVRHGLTNTAIAKLMGRTRRFVINNRKRLGLGFSTAHSGGKQEVKTDSPRDYARNPYVQNWTATKESALIILDALGID